MLTCNDQTTQKGQQHGGIYGVWQQRLVSFRWPSSPKTSRRKMEKRSATTNGRCRWSHEGLGAGGLPVVTACPRCHWNWMFVLPGVWRGCQRLDTESCCISGGDWVSCVFVSYRNQAKLTDGLCINHTFCWDPVCATIAEVCCSGHYLLWQVAFWLQWYQWLQCCVEK